MYDIHEAFEKATLIEKGWSSDVKYLCEDSMQTKYLVRIADIYKRSIKAKEFNHIKEALEFGLPVNEPINIEVDEQKIYTIYRWLEGVNAEVILPKLPVNKQYQLGVISGKYLQSMASLTTVDMNWEEHFTQKINRKKAAYLDCGVTLPFQEQVLQFIDNHMHLLKDRPITFLHGDFHAGNFIIDENELKILDFNRYDYGDAIDEFNRMHFNSKISEPFACGMIDGYTNFNPSQTFFELMALYSAVNLISSIPWGLNYSEKEFKNMIDFYYYIVDYYHEFDRVIPAWYKESNRYMKED